MTYFCHICTLEKGFRHNTRLVAEQKSDLDTVPCSWQMDCEQSGTFVAGSLQSQRWQAQKAGPHLRELPLATARAVGWGSRERQSGDWISPVRALDFRRCVSGLDEWHRWCGRWTSRSLSLVGFQSAKHWNSGDVIVDRHVGHSGDRAR